MSSTFTPLLGLEKHPQSNQAWTQGLHDLIDTVDRGASGNGVYFVSAQFNLTTMPSLAQATTRRHFPTIQEAINAGEADGWGADGYRIEIFPGIYDEKLSISRSVQIQPRGHAPGGFYAGDPVLIRGDGSASPIVSINPTPSEIGRFALVDLQFENSLSDDRTAQPQIDDAYALKIVQQNPPAGASNLLFVRGCQFRCQTWGLKNDWRYGFRLEGWVQTTFRDCQFGALIYGGGGSNGNIEALFSLKGFLTNLASTLMLKRCEIQHGEAAGYTNYTFEQDNDSVLEAAFSAWSRPFDLCYRALSSTNVYRYAIDQPSEIDELRNVPGYDLVRW